MTRWTLQAVEKAAPDAASLAAGRRLAVPGPWSETGSTETLVWGRCQGSGRTPYQVSIDLSGPAYRCSCPSRKFPCKHAIALLLLWVAADGAVEDAAEGSDFAASWAATRAQRAADQAAGATPKAVDPEARAKRIEDRLQLMDAGIDDFSLWLTDLVRGGIVQAKRQPLSWWDGAAGRLVDAQVPGLAERVREVASAVNRRQDWADHLLGEIGHWWTAVHAWQRRDDLDDRTRADLRAVLGWALPTEQVRAADEVTGRWQVLGAHRSDLGKLQEQRTWLRSVDDGETVVVLDFAVRGGPLPAAKLVGSVLDSTLARYPGSWPRRALFATEPGIAGSGAVLPPGADLGAALEVLAAAWSENPWTRRVPIVLDDVVLTGSEVIDGTGTRVAMLPTEDHWTLAALTGGRPTSVFGEFEEGGFRPLTVDLDEAGEAR